MSPTPGRLMKKLVISVLIMLLMLSIIAVPGCSVINSNQAVAHYNNGVTLGDAGKYDEAIAEYNQAIEIDPNYVSAYINLGWAYYQKKQYDLAITYYAKAIELDPDDITGYNGRGAAYLLTKQYQLAIADFDKSLKLKPGQVQIITNRDYAQNMLHSTIVPTTTPPPTTSVLPLRTLNGDWLDKPSSFGLSLFDGGSRWNYKVEMALQEDGQGKFSGTMKRTLVEITGPMSTQPEIIKEIGNVQTATVSGTHTDSTVEFVFGALTLHLTAGSDSYGVYLFGDTHFFDIGSAANNFKGLTDIRPPGVSGQDYIEWIYSINLKLK
jgi:tetratricopeptide (TPR) repeat protein